MTDTSERYFYWTKEAVREYQDSVVILKPNVLDRLVRFCTYNANANLIVTILALTSLAIFSLTVAETNWIVWRLSTLGIMMLFVSFIALSVLRAWNITSLEMFLSMWEPALTDAHPLKQCVEQMRQMYPFAEFQVCYITTSKRKGRNFPEHFILKCCTDPSLKSPWRTILVLKNGVEVIQPTTSLVPITA